MTSVSVCMGLLIRKLAEYDPEASVDERGYIQTTPDAWIKVNYTRKVQHFCAYFIPIFITIPNSCNCDGVIETAWGQWLTFDVLLVMIKPLREFGNTSTAYQYYVAEQKEDEMNAELSMEELIKRTGPQWANMSTEERSSYEQLAEKARRDQEGTFGTIKQYIGKFLCYSIILWIAQKIDLIP